MSGKISNYGVKPVKRPRIVATKSLNLSGEEGKQIINSESRLALRTHKKTFAKLADM